MINVCHKKEHEMKNGKKNCVMVVLFLCAQTSFVHGMCQDDEGIPMELMSESKTHVNGPPLLLRVEANLDDCAPLLARHVTFSPNYDSFDTAPAISHCGSGGLCDSDFYDPDDILKKSLKLRGVEPERAARVVYDLKTLKPEKYKRYCRQVCLQLKPTKGGGHARVGRLPLEDDLMDASAADAEQENDTLQGEKKTLKEKLYRTYKQAQQWRRGAIASVVISLTAVTGASLFSIMMVIMDEPDPEIGECQRLGFTAITHCINSLLQCAQG